jgi:hypothetical protein
VRAFKDVSDVHLKNVALRTPGDFQALSVRANAQHLAAKVADRRGKCGDFR